eukprot:683826-Pelagomonas_calceolata.AAC.5
MSMGYLDGRRAAPVHSVPIHRGGEALVVMLLPVAITLFSAGDDLQREKMVKCTVYSTFFD